MSDTLKDYPSYQLYNDVVNLLNDVNFPIPEIIPLMEKADKAWDRVDKTPCEPYINYFAEKYPKFYKYHPSLMVNFILKSRRINFVALKEFLVLRDKRLSNQVSKKDFEYHFGNVLFQTYIEPHLTDERDHLKNLDLTEAKKIAEEIEANNQNKN